MLLHNVVREKHIYFFVLIIECHTHYLVNLESTDIHSTSHFLSDVLRIDCDKLKCNLLCHLYQCLYHLMVMLFVGVWWPPTPLLLVPSLTLYPLLCQSISLSTPLTHSLSRSVLSLVFSLPSDSRLGSSLQYITLCYFKLSPIHLKSCY